MEVDEVRSLKKNDEQTSVLKVLLDFIVEEFAGVCVAIEIKTGEKYYFHWDLPRLTHVMRRDHDKGLFDNAPTKLYIDAYQGRIRAKRVA